MGIGVAISSARHAALAAGLQLQNEGAGIVSYHKDLQQHYQRYLRIRASFYEREQRRREAPFRERRLKRISDTVS